MKKKYFFFFIILIFTVSSLLAYCSDYKYRDTFDNLLRKFPYGNSLVPALHVTLDGLYNSFDFIKHFRSASEDDIIGLKLSYDDIKSFSTTYNCSKSGGFWLDECKNWKNFTFVYFNEDYKAKIKLHGTSMTPYFSSFGFLDLLYTRKFAKNLDYDPTLGGYSFAVKFKKEKFFNSYKRISLLSPYDDWSFFQNILNQYAQQNGLITTFGRPYILKINGLEVGVYLSQEKIDKELLERNYGITNYAILKSNDVWDKSSQNHQSSTDYTPEDKEQSGSSELSIGLAQNQLRKMLIALSENNSESLSRYFDLDYMAKISAFEILYGTNHSSIGDNRRYIYNLSNGYFYPSFRMEGNPIKLDTSLLKVIDSKNKYYEPDKILEILAADPLFQKKRNFYLSKFIKDKQYILDLYKNFSDKYYTLLNYSTKSTQNIKMRNEQGRDSFLHNINVIQNYLSYSKIYISKIINNNKTCEYSIYVDSFAQIAINNFSINKKIIKFNKYLKEGKNKIFFDNEICVDDIGLINIDLNNKIDKRHVFYNYEQILPKMNSNLDVFKYSDNGTLIEIKKGTYYINEDIEFPIDRNISIQAGTVFLMGNNRSIIFYNEFNALGNNKEKIIFRPQDKNFGSILVRANGNNVNIKFFDVSGGNEAYLDNIYSSGQFVILNGNVTIDNSYFSKSISDDGINIKYSNVAIYNSVFFNNSGDQIDLDYCNGILENNIFQVDKEFNNKWVTDGLDVSGSKLKIHLNSFYGLSDKGLSIGEKSKVIVLNNKFSENNMASAVKDSSHACFEKNTFINNGLDITGYIKKKMYGEPIIQLVDTENINTNSKIEIRENCNEIY